ncbi:glutathione peroxidase [Chitinophaga japonensis]|nr:glutathione peroxidase [Chitinophaga japonensis]
MKIYPLLMKATRLLGTNSKILRNDKGARPPVPLASLHVVSNTGDTIPLDRFAGRKLLLVNTASDCGYTAQYAELQQLQDRFPELVIIGFPANDFKEQEKGTDEEIARFCQVNFGVRFMLAAKSSVVKGPQQNPVFRWLTDAAANGWNEQPPEWNFSKYLVDETGALQCYFGPSVSPLGGKVIKAVQ